MRSWWARDLMAYAFLQQGEILQARETFEISLRQVQKENIVSGLIFTIEGLASLRLTQGKPERAARLFAWAEAMREKTGDHRPPVEENSVRRDLAVIHAKLDDADFARFSAEGQAMTVEQVIALALEPEEEKCLAEAPRDLDTLDREA